MAILQHAVWRKHGVEDDWDDEDDWRFWEANWEKPNGKYD
jgi:hypothetical protein